MEVPVLCSVEEFITKSNEVRVDGLMFNFDVEKTLSILGR
jgi:hypothetical protein